MKTKEELSALKEEFENLNKKFDELSEEELKQVTGGVIPVIFASVIQSVIRPGVANNFGNSSWKTDELPTETGNYKIGTDVELSQEWIPGAEKIIIDR